MDCYKWNYLPSPNTYPFTTNVDASFLDSPVRRIRVREFNEAKSRVHLGTRDRAKTIHHQPEYGPYVKNKKNK
jgi:hypothetical protein